ncbi:serine/threonine protein kinase [Akkermansiaceae bacterium]|nr:serine/threonine protein kinase [Akkermansiaceae bacterium]
MSLLPPDSYTQLYSEADEQALRASDELTEELCPLYHALGRIETRYTESETIGKGGMKEVYRVYDERTERHVALTRPKKGIPVARFDAFLREAHMTARLEHPNIIKLFDMGIDDHDGPFFTMELKTGPSLRKVLSNLRAGKDIESYPYQRRLSIILRICEAISYAHSQRVLHLDLKPENIQIGNFGEVQVCDWGMGQIERGDTEEHLSVSLLDPDLYGDQLEAVVKGTPGYMAPEQEDPRSTKTAQTEIYSIGCLLYELATLERPSAREKNPPESRALAAIVEKACAPLPHDRYLSVNAMQEDIRRHLDGFSPRVESTGFFREARRFYRRNRQPCLLTFFFSSLLLIAGIWFTQQLRESYRETSEALSQSEQSLKRTQIALTNLEQERVFSSVLLDQTTGDDPGDAILLFHNLMIDEAITENAIENSLEFMDRSLQKNPSSENPLWTQKGFILFITQRFSAAEPCYQKRPGNRRDLMEMIPDFSGLVREDGLLPAPDLIRLLKRLGSGEKTRSELIEKMVIYDCLHRKSLVDQGEIIKAVLMISNPQWEKPIFTYSPQRRHLRIGGERLKTLYRPFGNLTAESRGPALSLLRLLNLRSLDLRGSELSSMNELNGMVLEILDLRKCPISELPALQKMTSLRELTVEPEKLSKGQLKMIPEWVDLKFED